MDELLRRTNRALRHLGVILVPVPPSGKMLQEHANVSETHHPAGRGRTTQWLRRTAYVTDGRLSA